jgi:hypothetical protein
LSLNACPYRAKSVLHRRPLGWSMKATTILTRGGSSSRQSVKVAGDVTLDYAIQHLNQRSQSSARPKR